jgi:hypothetical protein
MADEERRARPPYIPFKTFLGLIERFQQTVVPSRVDVSLLRNYSGSVARQLIAALKFLDLIDDDGAVTDRLRGLVKAYGTPEWKDRIGEVVVDAYGEVTREISDIDVATPAELETAFRNYGAEGDVMRKCVSFWLAANLSAGWMISPHILHKPRARAERGRRHRRNGSEAPRLDGRLAGDDAADVTVPAVGTVRFSFPVPDKGRVTMVVPPDLSTDDWEMVNTIVTAYIARRDKTPA